MFSTLHDRLPKELALTGITGIEAANRFTEEIYLPAHNARFAKPPEVDKSGFVPVSGSKIRHKLGLAMGFQNRGHIFNGHGGAGRGSMRIRTVALATAFSSAAMTATAQIHDFPMDTHSDPFYLDTWKPTMSPLAPTGFEEWVRGSETPTDDAPEPLGTTGDARAALDEGRVDDAEAIYRSLVDQGDLGPRRALASLYFTGENGFRQSYEDALELYERAAEEGDTYAMIRLSFMYTNGLGTPRDSERAVFWQQRAAASSNAAGLSSLAYTYATESRNLEEALALAQEAVGREPGNGDFLDTLGFVLYRMGRYEEAVPPLCRAVQLIPERPEHHVHLGDLYWRLGDTSAAKRQWRIGLGLFDDPAAQENPDIRTLLTSAFGEEIRLGLRSRLAEGLPEGDTPTAAASPGKGAAAISVDDC